MPHSRTAPYLSIPSALFETLSCHSDVRDKIIKMARYTAFIALALLGMLALATAEVRSLQ